MRRLRPLHLTAALLRWLVYGIAAVLVLVVLGIAAVETGWVKNQIRRLIVSQANNYLTVTLDIGRLEGSVFRGLTLGDVRLTEAGKTIVSVDEVSVNYSIRELFEPGLIIRRVRLTRPHVIVAKLADGRWNLGALVKRERRDRERSGPGRPIHVLAIEIVDGDVELKDDLALGSVHAPTRYAPLNASFTYDYVPVTWKVNFARVSWAGDAEHLGMEQLTGGLSNGPDGWQFDSLSVQTPKGAFVVSGRVDRDTKPTSLDLHVEAKRFAFEEWSSVLGALGHIDVDSAFSLSLTGPVNKLATEIDLKSARGDVQSSLVLDTSVDGWHGTGRAQVARFDLSHWLSKPDRASDVTGNLTFDLDLDLGHHFPRGAFTFDGPHAAYIGYEAADLKARGTLTATDALIADATGVAYGSTFHLTSGSIGIDSPYAYRFQGADTGMNLTKLPPEVPITHVDSQMALDSFDVSGQFETPAFIKGGATFGESEYLGAAIAAGTVGTIDTSSTPVRYTGEGDVSRLDVHRFGEGLNTEWMLDPRWAGVVSGHFHVEGAGADSATMSIDGGGRLARADLFDGRLFDADVSVHIADGSLSGSYNGALTTIDTAKAFGDPSYAGTLTGRASATFAVRDLLVRDTQMADYSVDGTFDGEQSTVRGIQIDRGSITGALSGTTLNVKSLTTTGPFLDVDGSGLLEFDGERNSQFSYTIRSADLSLARNAVGDDVSGNVTTSGTLSGPMNAMHIVGNASLDNLDLDGVSVLSSTGQYDVTTPWDAPASARGTVAVSSTEIWTLGRDIPSAEGTLAFDNGRIDANLTIEPQTDTFQPLPVVKVSGTAALGANNRALALSRLTLTVGTTPAWQLTNGSPAPTVSWDSGGFQTDALEFADQATGNEHASLSGSWRADGSGALHLKGSGVSLDRLTGEAGGPGRYGGTLDVDATLRGTRDHPIVSAQVDIRDGRVRKLAYQRLAGTVGYEQGLFRVDLRLDQAPGVWLTANGTLPADAFDAKPGDTPIDLTLASSTVGLGLIEGVTDVVREVTGQLQLNVHVTGTGRQPQAAGTVALSDAAFLVSSTGAHYKNGRASLEIAADRVNVSSFHLEDRGGRPLDITGSLGTRALGVGDIHIDLSARHFEILHNETGTVDVSTNLTLRGDLDAPRIAGDLTILSGELKADEIFEQALFRPYATEEAAAPPSTSSAGASPASPAATAEAVDALAALNPWDRLALDISIHSPGTLRFTGDNVQIATGTPLGLGSFNLRATGDLYVYKDPGQQAYISGSFDSISGTYSFQGRRFDVDPSSSINFRGDFNPDVFLSVTREINGVVARVTIAGDLQHPELRLASTPPLDASDILSLIVFNTGSGDLSSTQQQELAVRAGTLAYGFVATPLVAALQRSLGLDTLEIVPASDLGPSVTIGNELVPGLVAQFTRGLGPEPYDEATIEYYLSRMLRLRATFSDAQSLIRISPFRRIERAGVDLLIFFSF